MKYILTLILILSVSLTSAAQVDKTHLTEFTDSLFTQAVDSNLIPGGVVGFTNSSGSFFLKGYGLANVELGTPISIDSTLFQLGSVGKVFTAIAALQQVEQGQLNMHTDVNEYLDVWKIENPFNTKLSLFHLLTHTGGINDRVIGYLEPSETEVQSIGTHLNQYMPGHFEAPGLHINYSNYGYVLAGHLVERVTEQPFEDYVKDHIFSPLGMNNSSYYLPDNYTSNPAYARGYQSTAMFVEKKSYPRSALPAGSIISTGEDMLSFVHAILTRSVLLNSDSYSSMYTQQFTNHEFLPGYTFGFEQLLENGYSGIVKGGSVPGFLSIVAVMPELDLGLFISINTETDNFLESFWKDFSDEFLPEQVNSNTIEDVQIIPSDYTGVYRNNRMSHNTIEELFSTFLGNFEIWENSDGNLVAYHNQALHEYIPISDLVFRNSKDPDIYIVFKRDESGHISRMYRSINIAGVQVPNSYRKAKWYERTRFYNDEYPIALVLIPIYLLAPLIWFIIWVIRRRNPAFYIDKQISWYYHIPAYIFAVLFIWHIVGFFIPLLQAVRGFDIAFGLADHLYIYKYLHWLMVLTVAALLYFNIRLWRGTGWLITKIYYSLFTIIGFSYILVLYRWHFLSMAY
ncbi:MAG: serine hydrolase domain-containing protein [Balneolaceae bacterium]